MTLWIQMASEPVRLGHPALGVIIPALIFALSAFVAMWLYRRFSRRA